MTEPHLDTLEDSLGPGNPKELLLEPHLFVVLEADRPASGGARYGLAGIDEVIIGRGAERSANEHRNVCGVRLKVNVPGRSMSTTQARLLRTTQGWVLEDAHSTNGSSVNGSRVERAVIHDGDVIELGHTVFLLRAALPTPRGTPRSFDGSSAKAAHAAVRTLIPALSAEFAALERLAESNLPLLLLGETGTGKELMARAIHLLSKRPGPFVAVNCGALVPSLLEGQLFGHLKGSFSGASRDELGFVRAANSGTLLLDEIGDLPASAQTVLLRVLQEHEVVPVGGTRAIPVDVRALAATHRPLDLLVHQQRFRADLFARLDGYRLTLPSLADRREDLGLLVAEILDAAALGSEYQMTADAAVALVSYAWPFNVRELVQHLKRGLVLAEERLITRAGLALPEMAVKPIAQLPNQPPILRELSAEDQRLKAELLRRLEDHGGNLADVARTMGKARMQIHRWLKRLEIEPARFRSRKR